MNFDINYNCSALDLECVHYQNMDSSLAMIAWLAYYAIVIYVAYRFIMGFFRWLIRTMGL